MSEKFKGACLSHRRNLANLRERKRMMLINKGFEVLRNRLPICELKSRYKVEGNKLSSRSRRCRLTKVDILRLTIEYIKQLTQMLNGSVETSVEDIVNFKLDHTRIIELKGRKQEIKRKCKAKQAIRSVQQDKKINRELVVCWESADKFQNDTARYILSCELKVCKQEVDRKTKLWVPGVE